MLAHPPEIQVVARGTARMDILYRAVAPRCRNAPLFVDIYIVREFLGQVEFRQDGASAIGGWFLEACDIFQSFEGLGADTGVLTGWIFFKG